LCSIAGGVAFLSHARVPPVFPPYDHNDLLASFQRVVGFIQLALSEGLVESWVSKEFTPLQTASEKPTDSERPSSTPILEIGPTLIDAFGAEADLSSTYLGLMVRLPASVSPDSMTEWGESCLLAPEDAIADLELSRSRGAVCERVDFLEDLVVAPASVLFRVRNDPQWINPHKKLVLKPAKQEIRVPDAVTLFIRKLPQAKKGA
jgi:type VI secretion system protein ImpJ